MVLLVTKEEVVRDPNVEGDEFLLHQPNKWETCCRYVSTIVNHSIPVSFGQSILASIHSNRLTN